jgi:type I restriction enzyme R subunit/putative DNA methylase
MGRYGILSPKSRRGRRVPGSAGVPAGLPETADILVGKNWYSRGYLPHRDEPRLRQFITYRLADSLPQEKLDVLEDELRLLPEERRESTRRQRIEAWLDAGMGCCALRHPEVAPFVQNAFLHFHGERYRLHAWCIMPNHVHVLIEPLTALAKIVQSWKSFTARWVLAHNAELELGVPGRILWMREYWDRYIRDENHHRKTVDYIHRNPVKAGLCATPEAWPWSSASVNNAPPGSAGVLAGLRTDAGGDAGAAGAHSRCK